MAAPANGQPKPGADGPLRNSQLYPKRRPVRPPGGAGGLPRTAPHSQPGERRRSGAAADPGGLAPPAGARSTAGRRPVDQPQNRGGGPGLRQRPLHRCSAGKPRPGRCGDQPRDSLQAGLRR